MELLPRLVTMAMSVMPDWMASSTPYWMTGLSTSTSISFGNTFVAGRNLVPRPAAGNTAFRIVRSMGAIVTQVQSPDARSGISPRQLGGCSHATADTRDRLLQRARGAGV